MAGRMSTSGGFALEEWVDAFTMAEKGVNFGGDVVVLYGRFLERFCPRAIWMNSQRFMNSWTSWNLERF